MFSTGLGGAALAGPQPNPPPSGVVVHLFGQNSVMSNVLPTSAATALGVPAGTAGSSTGAPAAEPTLGDIAHQMFVVGDPAHPPKPAPGKTAQHLAN
ncbi:MAG: hypothetical protein B7Z81_13635 [Acidocella sp. 20-61-6]|nr:MAG: hypothetical protein B7Z81_13635 [Acidocella sp. 20-61-6]